MTHEGPEATRDRITYTDSSVSAAGPDDIDEVVEILTTSFHADPAMTWAFPDPLTRPDRLAVMWRYLARGVYLPGGGSTILRHGETAVATALWLPPEAAPEDTLYEREGAAFVADLHGEVERLSELSDAMRTHHPDERAWYLLAVGVRPAGQGRGSGTRLLEATLAHLDGCGEAAYLEATSARSRVLYHRLGFSQISEFSAPGGPQQWGMWRPSA
jgi:GNAT superfamily N-acetyltransferase